MRLRRLAVVALSLALVLGSGAVAARPLPSVYLVLPDLPVLSITVVGGSVDLPTIGRTDTAGKTTSAGTLSFSAPSADHTISVSISPDPTNSALSLWVSAAEPACSLPDPCDAGASAGQVALSGSPTVVISSIGAVADGSAALTYGIATDGASSGGGTIEVTYTIAASP